MMDEGRAAPAAQGRKVKRVTPEYLDRAALHYLERFASSSANLRRLLLRRVTASAQAHGTDPAQGAEWVEALIARYLRSGLLNDGLYAEMKARGLQRRGGSTRAIRQKLRAKGLEDAEVDAAMGELEGAETGEADLAAAIAYARRRRLGGFRPDRGLDADAARARRDKDIAALARAGFDLETARRVIDADDPEGLLDA
ncbi:MULTISPECIES: regulatory protein RecX [unclassified Azospirillum]|uniref:regulatory protein RecX n=1 Tax=unclassified Azospirillum TaxID=2630922 RepID=UPI000B67DF98|nr:MULTISPECIES: RecX family transcriptional regulator [unclassified Azospirillum]SNS62766.1 regulatory protein [Azospirillum sp. RU38E]SNS81923.1 regulatory protein [Azospirillum sp. RU37A]